MKRFLVLLFLLFLAISACQTTDSVIPEYQSEGEYFLEAQKASSDSYDYNKALAIYSAYINRYPDKTQMVVEAEYEIAFIYYKMKDYDTALDRFNLILEKYKTQEAALLPAWPEILSKKLVENINEKLNDTKDSDAEAGKDVTSSENKTDKESEEE